MSEQQRQWSSSQDSEGRGGVGARKEMSERKGEKGSVDGIFYARDSLGLYIIAF